MPGGPAKGHVVELEQLLDDYYEIRGWDSNGIPTPEILDKLRLTDVRGLIELFVAKYLASL